jgi:hypothetical protein
MSLSELEQHVFAYYLANGAQNLTMVPRYWPYGELVLIVEDRIQLATRKFGVRVELTSPKVARAFLDLMIERGGFSTTKDDLSTMHQYQSEPYLKCVKELLETNPIVAKARAGSPTFWPDTFAALTKSS